MSESATKAEHSHVNSTLFDIVERNSPPDGEFYIVLPHGDRLKFRNYQNYEEFNGAKGEAIMYADGFSQVVAVRPELKPYAETDRETVIRAHLLGRLSFDYKVGDFLYIANRNPVLFDEIVQLVNQAVLGNEHAIYRGEIEAAKKE